MRSRLAPDLSDVIRYVADSYNIAQRIVLGRDRTKFVAEARAMAYYLARQEGHSFPRIAAAFQRDHSTILSGVRRIARLMRTEPVIANTVLAFGTWLENKQGNVCESVEHGLCNSSETPLVSLCVGSNAITPVDCLKSDGVESRPQNTEAAE